MSIFISVNITDDEVKLVPQKCSGDPDPGGTDPEALHKWLLQLGEDSKKIRTSVENFVNRIANGIPPWVAYRAFIYGRLVMLSKQTGVCPIGVRETWKHIFAKIFLKVTGPKATMECQDEQLCTRLKKVIDGAVHWVQANWDEKSNTEHFFSSFRRKNVFNKIIQIGMFWTVHNVWISRACFAFTGIVTGHRSF